MAESRMNLAALQQRDPYITEIVDTASQVALYSFSAKVNNWEKTSIEGSLFLYKRSAAPFHGFMILNRLGLNNLIEPISKELEFQLQDPFLLYRNAKAIYGIWFYDKEECSRIGKLMNSYLDLVLDKGSRDVLRRSVSESATTMATGVRNVDILQMLSKAQDEYDKCKTTKIPTDLKPFIDNPNAAATKASNIIRPTPLKIGGNQEDEEGAEFGESSKSGTTPATAPISLETLFRNASLQQTQSTELPNIPKTSALHRSLSVSEAEAHLTSQPPEPSSDSMPPLLKHIMSSGSMVEDIERGHWGSGDPRTLSRLAADTASHHQLTPRGGQGRTESSKGSKSTEKLLSISPHKSDPSDQNYPPHRQQKSKSKSPVGKFPKPMKSSATQQTKPPKSVSPGFQVPLLSQQAIQEGKEEEQGGAQDRSSDLLTPAALEKKLTALAGGASTLPERPPSSSLIGSDVLLTPMAFATVPVTKVSPIPTATFRQSVSEDSTPLDRSTASTSSDSLPVAALTREQMQQAMLYLIKNDSKFMDTLHEAYLNSLKDLAGSRP